MPNSVDWFVACVACWNLGAIPQPVSADPALSDAAAVLASIERHAVDVVYLVPTMMKRVLRVVWHLAEPCPSWLKEAWIDWLGAGRHDHHGHRLAHPPGFGRLRQLR